MTDQITLNRIQLLHPKLRTEALSIYNEICTALSGRAICRFAYTLRTFAEQDFIYAKGRTTKGVVVTDAIGGKSYHNYGLAIDIALILDNDGNGSFETVSWDMKSDYDGDLKSDWLEVEAIFTKYGWKGLFNKRGQHYDFPHFQKTFDYSVSELLILFNTKKLIPNTNYVAI